MLVASGDIWGRRGRRATVGGGRGMMLAQLAIAAGVTAITIVMHAAAMTAVVYVVRLLSELLRRSQRAVRVAHGVTVAGVLLMFAHIAEVLVWGIVYRLIGMTPNPDDAFYFAFVNYTTLGYGDMVPVPHWRLLGPMTAADGILLFGLSTAALFHVIVATGTPHPEGDVTIPPRP